MISPTVDYWKSVKIGKLSKLQTLKESKMAYYRDPKAPQIGRVKDIQEQIILDYLVQTHIDFLKAVPNELSWHKTRKERLKDVEKTFKVIKYKGKTKYTVEYLNGMRFDVTESDYRAAIDSWVEYELSSFFNYNGMIRSHLQSLTDEVLRIINTLGQGKIQDIEIVKTDEVPVLRGIDQTGKEVFWTPDYSYLVGPQIKDFHAGKTPTYPDYLSADASVLNKIKKNKARK